MDIMDHTVSVSNHVFELLSLYACMVFDAYNKQPIFFPFPPLLCYNASGYTSFTLAILDSRWCPCQVQILSQNLTNGALGRKRQFKSGGHVTRVTPAPTPYPASSVSLNNERRASKNARQCVNILTQLKALNPP